MTTYDEMRADYERMLKAEKAHIIDEWKAATGYDDLLKAYSEVSRRFADKMHPLQYQRPQAAPTAGAIAAAEAVFEKLGAARSLRRRYARLDDVQALWLPAAPETPANPGGIFGHLTPKSPPQAHQSLRIPPQTMTWAKFSRDVLPSAKTIEFLVPHGGQFTALVTAADPEAPPILQWDSEQSRNPVSWYVWQGGSLAANFALRGSSWAPLSAICLKPSMWGDHALSHHGRWLVLLIAGARDLRHAVAGVGLFPEILRAELRAIRSVIEAHSSGAKLEGADEQGACGYLLNDGENWNVRLRVTRGNDAPDEFVLDRWE